MNKLEINFGSAVSQFEKAIKKFEVKKIAYKSLFRGKGLEFSGYRNFGEDEDASMIDWKASLRAEKLLAKEYVEERDLNIYFVVDSSSNMLFGSGSKLKAEYAGELVSALSRLIMDSGDNAGLIMHSDKLSKILRACRSKNQFYLMLNYLSDLNYYGKKFDFDETVNFLLKTLPNGSVIILVSDFLDVNPEIHKRLKVLATKFETLAFMIRDPFDNELPHGNYQIVLQEPYSKKQMVVDASFAEEAYRKNALDQKNIVISLLSNSGIDMLELTTGEPFINPLIAFLKTRSGR